MSTSNSAMALFKDESLFISWKGRTRNKHESKYDDSEEKLVSLKKVAARLAFDALLLLFVFGLFAIGGVIAVKLTGREYVPNPDTCQCTCFDHYTKRGYFSEFGKQYKYIYLNFEFGTLVLLAWTGPYAMMLFACARRVLELFIFTRYLNRAVFLVAVVSYYQMFYNWWGTCNYFNDEWYNLFPTQMFFNITELLPAFVMYYLLDKRAVMHRYVVLAAQTVSFSHVFIALRDQGWVHFFGYLSGFLVVRDFMFLVGDLAPFILFFFYTGLPNRNTLAAQLILFSVLWAVYAIIKVIYGYQ